jgi:hypothetical protein
MHAHAHARARRRRDVQGRSLHVYGACLVTKAAGRETQVWNPGPVLAWDRKDAVVQAYFLAMRHSPLEGAARLKVWRVTARRSRRIAGKTAS